MKQIHFQSHRNTQQHYYCRINPISNTQRAATKGESSLKKTQQPKFQIPFTILFIKISLDFTTRLLVLIVCGGKM